MSNFWDDISRQELKALIELSKQNPKCPDCDGQLEGRYYGYTCLECGALFNDKIQPATIEDFI